MDLQTLIDKNIPLLFFDAECLLCSRSIQFILSRERNELIHFSSLKSKKARELGISTGKDSEALDSIVLFYNGKIYKESEAVLKSLRWLKIPYSWFYSFIIVPSFIRDPLYRWVSSNRYEWFGKIDDICTMIPDHYQHRLLE